ncbi:MAG: periplasmic heavy metal sensor [Bacteroidota bacterium]
MKKVVLVIIGLIIGSMLKAQQGRGQQRGSDQAPGMDRQEMMKERLNLSEDQEQQMESIRTKFLGDVQSIKDQLDIKRAELKAAINSEASENVVHEFISEINLLNGQRFEKEIERTQEVRSILDDDQKVIFNAIAARRGERHMRKGKRGKYRSIFQG